MTARGIIEVDTPLLRPWPSPDVHVHSLHLGGDSYLQASPEAAMKVLLAAGSGPIYQLGHVFRADECGRLHAPEFTLLEWYRPGFDESMMMGELEELLAELGFAKPVRLDYAHAFAEHGGLDPHAAPLKRLVKHAYNLGLTRPPTDRALLLDFIFSMQILPALGHKTPTLLMDFPACQAGLAVINGASPSVAKRFELVINGIEIANGCRELVEPEALCARLAETYKAHAVPGQRAVSLDQELFTAGESGIPACAGVALGVDRLYMVLDDVSHIGEVLCQVSREWRKGKNRAAFREMTLAYFAGAARSE